MNLSTARRSLVETVTTYTSAMRAAPPAIVNAARTPLVSSAMMLPGAPGRSRRTQLPATLPKPPAASRVPATVRRQAARAGTVTR